MATFQTGDIVVAGYPTAHVYNFKRNSRTKKLGLSKIKHLLWGDWVKVSDYSYAADPKADLKSDAEKTATSTPPDGMVPVRVRGVSGYMYERDLERERLLEVVFVDVGQGDGALVVTPGDKRYVVDAGKGDNMYRYLRWRFAGFSNPGDDFDGLIVTHADNDHYLGFMDLIEDTRVSASVIWHNGLVEQFGVKPDGSQSTSSKDLLGATSISSGQLYITGLIETDKDIRDLLKDDTRWIKTTTGRPKQYPELLNTALKAKAGNKRRFPKIEMLSTQHGEHHEGKTYLPGHSPLQNEDLTIEILGPFVEPASDGAPRLRAFGPKPKEKNKTLNTGKTKNGHSVLLKLNYRDMTLLLGGDLNSSAEMFLLEQYTGLPVYDPLAVSVEDIVEAAAPTFRADVAKSCHHGSADFTDHFLGTINAAATIVSSGDEEGHAHPRSDTLGALGHHGRGQRSLIFSTELSRSSPEYTSRKDSPWYQASRLEAQAAVTTDPAKKKKLQDKADALFERDKKLNVTVYGAINLRSDGEKVVLAYMLERPSASKRWDVYTLEPRMGGALRYLPVKEARAAEAARRKSD